MILRRTFAVLALTVVAANAAAAEVRTERFTQELPIQGAGSILINTLVGDIDIQGTADDVVSMIADKTVRGVDAKAVEEGRRLTELRVAGNEQGYMFTTITPWIASPRWSSSVKYTVRVPRTIDVRVVTTASRVFVKDIRGSVNVTHTHGEIVLQDLSGRIFVDSANGNIRYIANRGMSSAFLRSTNGTIEVLAPSDADFQWAGESGSGDVRTTFPVRLRAQGPMGFRGSVNAAGGPTITTATLLGKIRLLQNGTDAAAAKVVPIPLPNIAAPRPQVFVGMPGQPIIREIVEGSFAARTSMGSVRIREVRGPARVTTGAGEVNLGAVFGDCQVISSGGPLNLGDILGALIARTEAGDILVQSANKGGLITTGGGIIRLLYTNGPTHLTSGGGDIVVRHAAASITAETRSGDITITLDPASRTEKISARTSKGNVLLNVTPRFAGDIDATLITSDPDLNRFKSDFPQLSVQRDQVGGKTRIRITGKVNGGGEKVELYAEDGGIQITTNSGLPISVVAPR